MQDTSYYRKEWLGCLRDQTLARHDHEAQTDHSTMASPETRVNDKLQHSYCYY